MSDAPGAATVHALRAASAAAICLVCAVWLQLEQPGLAVWSTHMVMIQVSFTTFQKGVERILGRGFGILVALLIATFTRNAWSLGFILEMLAIVPLFYIYFSGRLSYTFLNAGLYLASTMELSRAHPDSTLQLAAAQFLAVVVGVTVAVLVVWVSREERDVKIHTEGQALLPIDRDRLLHSLMLMITVAVVQVACRLLDTSTTTTIVSVMVLAITPDYQSLIHKGELRLVGAFLAIVYAAVALTLLVRLPSFPLLVVAIFLGMYLAVWLARSSDKYAYAGIQMGLVLPMILVAPHAELGSLHTAMARVAGALLAIAASIVVGVVWAAFAPLPPLPLTAAVPAPQK